MKFGFGPQQSALIKNPVVAWEPDAMGKGLVPSPADPDGYGYYNSFPPVATHGDVQPVGVADLLVVRQQLKKYEGGDVAYVENVLRSESISRETRRLEKTEQTFLTETENEKEEQRDLQATDRFSLQRESQSTIKEDSSLKAGLSLSGKYGPVVEMKAYVNSAQTSSSEQTSRQSSSFAREVTTRAATRISEKIREQRTQINIMEFEEKARHAFENSNGANISGVYQWVDKILEGQVYNFGKRLMFDIIVPEPACFLIHSARKKIEDQLSVANKPPAFTYLPVDITEANYLSIAQQYGATNLDPPPLEFIQISKAYDEKAPDGNAKISKSEVLSIPDGYEAINYYASYSYRYSTGSNYSFYLNVGGHNGFAENLDHQVGSIPFLLFTWNIFAYGFELEILCQRSARARVLWQGKTHAAIYEAFQKMQSDYEKALATANATSGPPISGQNPMENRSLEQAELKKTCLMTLTNQAFQGFGAIQLSAQGYPEENLKAATAHAKYIRFFEQAFEWEHMMYFHYPYYWADKERWLKIIWKTDVDPMFRDFLRAGSTRVVFPVRPGFEAAVVHFLETGETWNGSDPIDINSSMYVNIVDEIKSSQQASQGEIPTGDPWDVRLPTTLVKLRLDDKLPSWKKDQTGAWIEA